MAYLVIIVVVAVAGIAKLSLQQRREHKLNIENDYRSSLQKVATQPLAGPATDDGPRRRFELAGWAERKRAQDPARRRTANGSSRKPAETKKRPERRAPRRQPAASPNGRNRSAQRKRGESRNRIARGNAPMQEAELEWNSQDARAPQRIDLAHDAAPRSLNHGAPRLSQPAGRGVLRTQFHAAIHPIHMPPPVDYGIDPRAYDDHDSSLWMAWERELAAESHYRSVTAGRRAG